MNVLLVTNSIEQSRNFICQLLQTAWDSAAEKDKRKKKTPKDFLNESSYFKIIDDKKKYEALDDNFIPEIVFIVPELKWDDNGVNEGYNIARELITSKYNNYYIQVVFLSVLNRSSLRKIADAQNYSFIEAFPHVCLLDSGVEIHFSYYSDIHYKLIKHLAVSAKGRLQKIDHEMNSVKTNILRGTRQVDLNRADLLAKLEELSLFQEWTKIIISDEINKVKSASDNKQLADASRIVDMIIDDLDLNMPSIDDVSKDTVLRHKLPYKVFIIEDDKEYRKFFRQIFSSFYDQVYPDNSGSYPLNTKTQPFDITQAEEIIKTTGKNYNIFLLDLLYKDDDGYWLNFNGLDLYSLVKKVNPYAVRRIITSLPRGIVAKLVEVIMSDSEKPNSDQVITKKYGFDALKDYIIESVEKINEECRLNAKRKTVISPFPKIGIFNWPGVPDLMHSLLHDKKDEYLEYRKISQVFFNDYLNMTLTIDTQGWNMGQLAQPGKKDSIQHDFFLKKLSIIMAHRMIVLREALKNDSYEIVYDDYAQNIMGFTQFRNVDKGYFQTKLGFHVKEKKEGKTPVSCMISFNNLFPEEINYVTTTLSEQTPTRPDTLLNRYNNDLDDFFKLVLSEPITYENWEALELEFDPYLNQRADIDKGKAISKENLLSCSLRKLILFLQALVNNYSNEYIEPIITFITDNPPANITDRSVRILIDSLYDDVYK